MQNVPSVPSASWTTYERIQRMSDDISSSPTCADRAAAASSSLPLSQPLGRRITYSSIPSLLVINHDRSCGICITSTTVRANLDCVSSTQTRKRRSDGERSRAAILEEAAKLSTVEGLGGLSLGRLADAVGMSKSGLFAHFGSKEELQLATVEAAAGVFEAHVVEPAMRAPGGLARLHAFVDHYLRYVEQDVFPGGCFFAAALTEMNMQPGPVRDRLVALADTVREGQAKGELDPNEYPDQLAFEMEAAFFLANNQFVVKHSPEPLERARRTIEQRLAAITL